MILKQKKISASLIMIGIFGIIYGVMNKEFVGNNAEIYNTIISSYPLRFNTISFFGMSFKLINFLLINEILIMLGIYTFLFYDDREIKKILKVKKKCNLGDTALNQNSHEYFTWDEYKDIMNYEKLYLKFDPVDNSLILSNEKEDLYRLNKDFDTKKKIIFIVVNSEYYSPLLYYV